MKTSSIGTQNIENTYFQKHLRPIYIITLLLLFGSFTVYHYYFVWQAAASHRAWFGLGWYLTWIFLCLLPWIFWVVSKDFFMAENRKIRWWEIILGFLWVLWVTAITTTQLAQKGVSSWILFFFEILKFAIPVLILACIFTGIGKKILVLTKLDSSIPKNISTGLSMVMGWSVYTSLLSILGFFGWYNIYAVYILLIVGGVFSGREIWSSIHQVFMGELETGGYALERGKNVSVHFSKKQSSKTGGKTMLWIFYSLVHSFFFSLFAMIVSVNLVNIYRPFPIGWDDLGVYMNVPKLIANAQNTSEQWLIFWQVFTGIGFMHESATFAFYLNAFASLLGFTAIWGATKYFMQEVNWRGTKWKLSFPLIFITLFASLPMIVFQQAKDMKLDSWLLAVLIMSITTLFIGLNEKEKGNRIKFLLLAGGIAGIAFAIKLTSLLLVIGALGVIWFYRGKIAGLISYLLLFIGIFTMGRLWDFMNISYPKNAVNEITLFSIVTIVLWIIVLVALAQKWQEGRKRVVIILQETLLFILGFILVFLPWMTKNIGEMQSNGQTFSVYGLLNGASKTFTPDYGKIYDSSTLEQIKEKTKSRDIDDNGQIANEDFGRYFWYENGINNYLKLPYNLTMQINQSGEFTDIWYLFLALIPPAIYFFLRTALWYILYSSYLISLFVIFFTKGSWIQETLTKLFGGISLPIGYAVIAALCFFPLILLWTDARLTRQKNTESTTLFQSLFVFISIYTLLFMMSAFGIVWYGILAYFGFMLLFWLSYGKIFITPDTEANEEGGDIPFSANTKITLALLLVMILLPYFGYTVMARAWNNIPGPQDSLEYKLGNYNEYEAVFLNRPEYITTLSTINLKDPKKFDSSIRNATSNADLLELFQKYPQASIPLTLSILESAQNADKIENIAKRVALKNEATRLKTLVFKGILYPEEDNKNDAAIYRVGTFLPYYISENRSRFFEDSLIFSFEPYLKGKTPDETAANLRKIGIKYLLLDLNAATIDRDPKKDLTRRYEQLLDFVRSDKVRLIATDSLCLQLGLELKNDPNYMLVAGANYNSYKKMEDGKDAIITSQQKNLICLQNIAQIITEKGVSSTKFAFLQNYANYLEKNKITDKKEIIEALYPYIQRSWMASFEILD